MKTFLHVSAAHQHARSSVLRCSCLEIYNDTMYDFLAPSSAPAIQLQGSGANVWLTPLGGCDEPRGCAFSFFLVVRSEIWKNKVSQYTKTRLEIAWARMYVRECIVVSGSSCIGHETSRDQQNSVGYSREQRENGGCIADDSRLFPNIL
jgi:hypothetical protein